MTAEARLDITGNTDEAQKQLDKLTKKVAELTEKMRVMGATSKKGHEEQHGWLQEHIADISRMAIGFLSVEKGVEKVVEFYKDWQEELHKTGEAHEKFTTDLVRQLARAGDLAKAQHIEHFLGSIPGVTREQASAAFAGVRGSAPLESLERREQLTKASLSMAPAMREPADIGAFGGAVGLIGKLMPATEAGDVADVTAKMQAVMGDQFADLGDDKMQRGIKSMISAGMSPEDALGLVVSAKKANAKRGIMDKMFSIMEATKKELRPTATDHSEKAKAERKLARVEGLDRLKMLMSDPGMASAFGEQASEFRRIAPLLGKTGGDELRAAEREDFAQVGKQLAVTPIGREALSEQALLAQKEQFTKKYGEEASLLKRGRESALAGAANAGFGSRMAEGFAQSVDWMFTATGAQSRTSELGIYASSSNVDPGVRSEITQYLAELNKSLRENTAATKANTPHSKNVDAHTE